jgi:hypothetical protein
MQKNITTGWDSETPSVRQSIGNVSMTNTGGGGEQNDDMDGQ